MNEIFYKCDQKRQACGPNKHCGLCYYTTDITNAANFQYDPESKVFQEKISDDNGEWIQLEGGAYKCSRCGYQAKKTVMGRPYYHYCPMCGQRKPETYKDFIVEEEK